MGLSWWEARIAPKLAFQQISGFHREAKVEQLFKKEKKKSIPNIKGLRISLTKLRYLKFDLNSAKANWWQRPSGNVFEED